MIKSTLKKYGYYILAFALILVVGIVAGISNSTYEATIPTGNSPIEMLCPMNSCEVLKNYSDTELFYNSTLKQWESHKAVDLTSKESADVLSVLDGKVLDSSYSYENGYSITIDHGDGLSTVYCSLSSNSDLKKGDTVTRGQKIGEASNSSANENLDGNHLHFAVQLNGNSVDPSNYITFENK